MTVLIFHEACNRWISREHQHACPMSRQEVRARRDARQAKEAEIAALNRQKWRA